MKYVIVTGASGGMGRATILKLLSEGYFVIGLDIINNDDVKIININNLSAILLMNLR